MGVPSHDPHVLLTGRTAAGHHDTTLALRTPPTPGPPMLRHTLAAAALLAALPAAADEKPRYAGPTANGFLLPNGWTLTPAGRHVVLADMPLNIVPLNGRPPALVATSGYNNHELAAVDLTD